MTARREATVSSKVTGKVVEVLVEEGMKVREGQVLAKLDGSNVEVSHRLALAQQESARQSLPSAHLATAPGTERRCRGLAPAAIFREGEGLCPPQEEETHV